MHLAFLSTSLGSDCCSLYMFPKSSPPSLPGNKNGFPVTQGFVREQDMADSERKTRQEPEPCYTWQWWASRKRTVLSPPSLLFPLPKGELKKGGRICHSGGTGTAAGAAGAQGVHSCLHGTFRDSERGCSERRGMQRCPKLQQWRKSKLSLLVKGGFIFKGAVGRKDRFWRKTQADYYRWRKRGLGQSRGLHVCRWQG